MELIDDISIVLTNQEFINSFDFIINEDTSNYLTIDIDLQLNNLSSYNQLLFKNKLLSLDFVNEVEIYNNIEINNFQKKTTNKLNNNSNNNSNNNNNNNNNQSNNKNEIIENKTIKKNNMNNNTNKNNNAEFKNHRVENTFNLIKNASGLEDKDLLRNITKPSETLSFKKVEASNILHNYLMKLMPSSYPGHSGFNPNHLDNRLELFYALILDGDNRANHLYFYQDLEYRAVFTPNSSEIIRKYYNLASDENGYLISSNLNNSLIKALDKDPLLPQLRQNPIQFLDNIYFLDDIFLINKTNQEIKQENLNKVLKNAKTKFSENEIKELFEVTLSLNEYTNIDNFNINNQILKGLNIKNDNDYTYFSPDNKLSSVIADSQQMFMLDKQHLFKTINNLYKNESNISQTQYLEKWVNYLAKTKFHTNSNYNKELAKMETYLRHVYYGLLSNKTSIPKKTKVEKFV